MALPAVPDKRTSIRFTKAFQVSVAFGEFAEIPAVARNISAGGMLIELVQPPPLGTLVTVHFRMPDSDSAITVRAEVKNHYYFNYWEDGEPRRACGMGVRFVEFVDDGEDHLRLSFTKWRTLH
jgi:c-di-GMP-binding flagellar brake protein YcgR